MVDSVEDDELKRVSDHYWGLDREDGLNHRSDWLISFALTARGSNTRYAYCQIYP